MPDQPAIQAAGFESAGNRPVMLAIAGDSAAGKTTLSQGLVEALGEDRVVAISVDDYHRYDREERKELPFTALHPKCNYVDIMEQHLQLLSYGHPVLKPVYNHDNGKLERPVLVEPCDLVVAEGLLPLYTKGSQDCFDVRVYLDPDEDVRVSWKMKRDTGKRGYDEDQVREELKKREPEAAEFIHPQKAQADIVVSFAPVEGKDELEGSPSATILLRPTVPHPNLAEIITEDNREAVHLKLTRDADGRPVDAVHVHGYAKREVMRPIEEAIWKELGVDRPLPDCLGMIEEDKRSESLALIQLILLFHVLRKQTVEEAEVPKP